MECLHLMLIRPKDKPWQEIKEVPCGQCIACRLNKAREWATRIMHESKMYNENCFLTLTYDQQHAPWVNDFRTTVLKSDMQTFMKDLRSHIAPVKVKFYGVGEYGEKKGRAHYHICLMGWIPKDLVLWKKTKAGNLYTSVELDKVWKNGRVIVGNLDFDSAGYVARYCTKLLTGKAAEYYERENIVPEFALMSRRPGIGKAWLDKYGKEIKSFHNVVFKGKKYKVPRYYKDKVYDEMDRDIERDSISSYILAKAEEVKKDIDDDMKIFIKSKGKVYINTQGDREKAREAKIMTTLKKRGG